MPFFNDMLEMRSELRYERQNAEERYDSGYDAGYRDGQRAGLADGLITGKSRGARDEAFRISCKLLEMNILTTEQITQVIGISSEEIKNGNKIISKVKPKICSREKIFIGKSFS